MSKLNIIGCGPGNADYLITPAKEKIKDADILVGSKKTLEIANKINPFPEEKITIDKNIEKIIDYIEKNITHKNITVLLTGDPGFFSLFNILKKRLNRESFNIIPGISSIQLAFARLNEVWHDAAILSLHGRDQNLDKLTNLLLQGEKTAVLLGNIDTHDLKKKLIIHNVPKDQQVAICARLSLPGETIIKTTLEKLDEHPPEKDCLLMFPPGEKTKNFENEKEQNYNYAPGMIKDEEFIRDNIPMTKEEVRTIILAKLKLFPGAIMWDIGAGTGSISIQAARQLGSQGIVYSVDHKKEAIKLIEKNLQKFGCHQVIPTQGKAPEILNELDMPHRVVIGGSNKQIEKILKLLEELKDFKGPLVIPTIALETFEYAFGFFKKKKNWSLDVTKVQINNLEMHSNLSMWKSKNPVSIITAEKVD